MPTKPFEKLLYRELRKAEVKDIIDIASPLLKELINYATNLFERCQSSIKDVEKDEPLPVLNSYYHIIGMTDGIEVLISQSCVIPAIPLLRSSFEALLSMEYILKQDSRKRAFSWLIFHVHNKIKLYNLIDSTTQQGKDFRSSLVKERLDKYIDFQELPDVKKSKQNLLSLLNNRNYKESNTEFQIMKRAKKKIINWFSLYGGPNNLRDLADSLNRRSQYDFLYRYWSNITHAGTLSNFLTKNKKGEPAFEHIRNNKDLAFIANMASTFIIDASRLMLN